MMGKINDTLSIAAWRCLFLLFAGLTVVVGALFFFLVPDSPETAWFLTESDRKLARLRTKENQLGTTDTKFKWYQVREVLLDPAVWLLSIVSMATMIPSAGLTNFYAIIVKSMGFSAEYTLLMSTAGAWNVAAVLGFPWLAAKFRRRALVAILPMLLSMAGVIMVWVAKNKVARFVGYMLGTGCTAGFSLALSLVTSNVAGRTKKTTANAMFFIFFCVGSLVGPQCFKQKDAPAYVPALTVIVVMLAVCILLFIATHFLYAHRNRKRVWTEGNEPLAADSEDLTDRENPHFHYAL
ncbi:hypothetical protein VHUM_01484 [Vanrija humicola]|uniref:Major facilitator superfamily (MFS) profile domain-containing protein n=1 Tax=Vanrija humicola TaxID=5417 RepID=A0A7D8V1R6_VANHU|nr:hypothetical protein VHUM_01484 [Vanrija humicola]